MTKLDWSRAKNRSTNGRPTRDTELRQLAYDHFVREHHLDCFNCHTRIGPWAKVGTTANRRWAICTTCIKSGK